MKNKTGLQMKYFVLKPAGKGPYAAASRYAMASYAGIIERENPQLAYDLKSWVAELEGLMVEGPIIKNGEL